MSFILDALKKSEAERQRQAGPTLLEVRVLPPRRKLPIWGIVIAVLLGANLLALVWFVTRHPAQAAASSSVAPTAAPAPAPAPVPASTPAPTSATSATSATANARGAAADSADPAIGGAAAVPSAPAPMTMGEDRNPADFAPAVPANGGTVTLQHDLQSLPTFNDVTGVPPLHLDLHVYSSSVPERYALINMHKVHEGDVLPEGARVVQITRDGVVLDYRGQDFILGQQQQQQ